MLRVWTLALSSLLAGAALAQDVPGIEICTVDKTMEKRTSCLQSNVEFLVKTISRMKSENEQRLDAANRQIAAQKATITELQKSVAEAHAKAERALKEAPAKGALAPGPSDAKKDTVPAAGAK